MFLLIASAVVLCFFALDRYLLSYWSRKSFPQLSPEFVFGDIRGVLSKKISLTELVTRSYREFKHLKVLGLYFSYRPVLLVFDPDLAKKILIKDYASFSDRSTYSNKKKNPLSNHLFNLRGEKYKRVRSRLTAAFTPLQLKQMLTIIEDCSNKLKKFISQKVETGSNDVEFRELTSRYMNTLLSSAIFGIENDCINERDNVFYRMNLKVFTPGRMATIRKFFHFLTPSLIGMLGLKMVDQEVEDYILSIVHQSVELRKSKEFQRNDVMQIFIDMMNSDEMGDFGMTDLAANVFLFFLAGNESVATSLAACLYELVMKPDLMIKVQEEIDETYKESEITYESLKGLKIVDRCMAETVRKFPGSPMVTRECTADYKILETPLVIPKGTQIYIPVADMHFDEEYFESPRDFDPDRFNESPTGTTKTEGSAYLPFGEGPKNCIGEAMGRLIFKHALVTVLSEYNFELSNADEAKAALNHDMQEFTMILQNKIHFKLSPRLKNQ